MMKSNEEKKRGLFGELRDLLRFNRSVRRFHADRPIPYVTLESLVELTRWCASSQNVQPLRYRIVDDPEGKANLFPALKWARHLKDWDGPTPSERPAAYIVQVLDTELYATPFCDCGLELEVITLGAATQGINSCIIRNFNPKEVHEILGLEDKYRVEYVVALGYASETVRLKDMEPGGKEFNYYRDEDDNHIVPKRPLSDRII